MFIQLYNSKRKTRAKKDAPPAEWCGGACDMAKAEVLMSSLPQSLLVRLALRNPIPLRAVGKFGTR